MRRVKYTGFIVLGLLALSFMAGPLSAQQGPSASADQAQLLAVLKSDAPLYEKAKACQQLAVFGKAEAVPVLAGLLGDEQLGHYARFGLESNPDPAVDDALRDALGKLQGKLLVGVINSIGFRRDVKAVVPLAELLKNPDAQVATAAAAALGRIHTPEAIQALRAAYDSVASLRPDLGAAGLTAADMLLAEGKAAEAIEILDAVRQGEMPQQIKTAVLQGAILARGPQGLAMALECLNSSDEAEFAVGLATVQRLPGAEVTKAVLEQLTKLMPASDAAAEPLKVLKAEYGAQDKWVDVTAKVAEAIQNSSLTLKVGNGLAGDPAPGVVKHLRVSYVLAGKEQSANVAEGQALEILQEQAAYLRPVLLVYALGARGDKVALGPIVELAKRGAAPVRLAAVRMLANLGDPSVVPVLLETTISAQGDLAQAAQDSLAALPGKEIDAALVAALEQSQGSQLLAVIQLTGLRGIAAAAPALEKLADRDDVQIHAAAIGALALTVGPDSLPAMIERLVKAKTPEATAAMKEALRKACLRMPDREACAAALIAAMDKAPVAAQGELLSLLGVVGGETALKAVMAAAKTGSDPIQDSATRSLGEWMSPDAGPVLLELATSRQSKYALRALRGYIRIARQLQMPPQDRLAMCEKAMQACGRLEEKKLVLDVYTRVWSPESLAALTPYLSDPDLKETAAAAAVKISQKIAKDQPAAVAAAMPKVLEATSDATVMTNAKALLEQTQK